MAPTEPPPCRWQLPNPEAADSDGVVGIGGDLAPGTLLAAYRQGLFPMHIDRRGRILGWWAPDPRGVLPLEAFRVSRSLRRSARRFEIRIDTAFAEVVTACAEPRPRGGHWIRPAIVEAYVELHRLGWTHSVEAWDRDTGLLAGGLYGVAIGGLFAGESMFHRVTDASKAALMGLIGILGQDGDPRRLVDVQWLTPHLASLGAVEIPATEYLARLSAALDAALPPAFAGR